MPRTRGKISKACQTDYVILTEDQVQRIVEKCLSHHQEDLQKLQQDINNLKSANENVTNSKEKEVEARNNAVKKLKADITELKSTVEYQSMEIDSLNNLQQVSDCALEKLQESYENIEEEQVLTTRKLHSVEDSNTNSIMNIEETLDQVEQNMKSNNIRIAGMVEEEGEDLPVKVSNLVNNVMKLENFSTTDIKAVSRMGIRKQTKTRDILLHIHSSEKRDLLYQKRKLLMKSHVDDPIYINEDLTSARSKLFFEARKLRKKQKLFGTWTQYGNVMIKLKETSPPQAVRNYKQLKEIVQQDSNWETESVFSNINGDDNSQGLD